MSEHQLTRRELLAGSSHDVPNLFICDGSSFVTSGRGRATMTIQALAFRAAERIASLARSYGV
jgi:choline dehydrogenase-like flavoprotein